MKKPSYRRNKKKKKFSKILKMQIKKSCSLNNNQWIQKMKPSISLKLEKVFSSNQINFKNRVLKKKMLPNISKRHLNSKFLIYKLILTNKMELLLHTKNKLMILQTILTKKIAILQNPKNTKNNLKMNTSIRLLSNNKKLALYIFKTKKNQQLQECN